MQGVAIQNHHGVLWNELALVHEVLGGTVWRRHPEGCMNALSLNILSW